MEIKLFDGFEEAKSTLEENVPRLALAGEQRICIVRTGQELLAFANECPHMGAELHKGTINFQGEIVCPLHSYRFNMKTGGSSQSNCDPLKTYPVRQKGGIFVEIG